MKIETEVLEVPEVPLLTYFTIRKMEIQTFRPTYQPKAERKQAIKNGKEFDYLRMKIRADLIEKLDAIRPKEKTLTVFLNNAISSFLNTRKIPLSLDKNETLLL